MLEKRCEFHMYMDILLCLGVKSACFMHILTIYFSLGVNFICFMDILVDISSYSTKLQLSQTEEEIGSKKEA